MIPAHASLPIAEIERMLVSAGAWVRGFVKPISAHELLAQYKQPVVRGGFRG
jgi:hypothetical protein